MQNQQVNKVMGMMHLNMNCNDGKCNQSRMGKEHTHKIKDASDEFSETVLGIFQQRVSYEFEAVASAETKASILIATCVAILGILFVTNNVLDLTKIGNEFYKHLILIATIFPFVISFFLGIIVVFPRTRFSLIEPRKFNDNYGNEDIDEVKQQLRRSMILNYENINKHRMKDVLCLKLGYITLTIGVMSVIILFIIDKILIA